MPLSAAMVPSSPQCVVVWSTPGGRTGACAGAVRSPVTLPPSRVHGGIARCNDRGRPDHSLTSRAPYNEQEHTPLVGRAGGTLVGKRCQAWGRTLRARMRAAAHRGDRRRRTRMADPQETLAAYRTMWQTY